MQSIDLLYRLFVEPSWKRINAAISRQEMSYFDGCNGVSLIYLSVMVAKIHTTLLRLWNISHPSLILTTFSIDLWRISFFIFISTFIPFIEEEKSTKVKLKTSKFHSARLTSVLVYCKYFHI